MAPNCVLVALVLPWAAATPLKPSKAIIGYWGSGGDTPKLEQLPEALKHGYNVISLAFGDTLTPDGGFRIKTNIGVPGDAPSKANISTIADVDIDSWQYLLSFGGQNAPGPVINDVDKYVVGFMDAYHAARKQYGFDGIDIDIEGGLSGNLMKAYRKIFPLMHKEGQIISMAPAPLFIDPEESSTFTPGAFNSYVPLVDTTMIDNVDYIAIQLYCNPMPLGDLDKYLASMQKSHKINALGQSFEINIPSSKFVFGFPSGATSGKASQAWESDPSTLVAHYRASPALMATGGAMTWAIGWDASSGWKWIDSVAQLWGVGPPPAPPVPTPTPPTPPAPPAPMPTPPAPAPTPPSPSPSPSDCPGGTLTACIALCPIDTQYTACVQDCADRCLSSIAV